MGLKDELVVVTDPPEEAKQTESAEQIELSEQVDSKADAPESTEASTTDSTPDNSGDDQSESTSSTASTESSEEQAAPLEEEKEVEEEEVTEKVVVEEEEEEEEDLVDPQDTLKEQCAERSECQRLKDVMDECTARVSAKENTTETCTQELFDFLHCVDHCVSKTIFNHLK